jgi:hypothetical protein
MVKYVYILLVVVSGFLFSCHSTKKIQTAITPRDTTAVIIPPSNRDKEDSVNFIKKNYADIISHIIGFTTFSAKIDVDYEDADGKKNNVNAHIRMYKDSVIWISITGALGFEGLRAYITPDSVKLLDKQNKNYIIRSVSYLQDVTELPLDLATLQDLLIGNPVFLDSNIISYTKSADVISLLSIGEFFKNLFTIGETDKLIKSSKLDDMDELKNRTCYLTYDDYYDRDGVNFSTKREISVTEKKKLDIKLNFKQYGFNETLSFPFSVPKNYKRN